MFEQEFIDNLHSPCCPYCGKEMHESHSKMWTGKNWKFLAIEFCCFNQNDRPHEIKIRARTSTEWSNHLKKLKFLVSEGV